MKTKLKFSVDEIVAISTVLNLIYEIPFNALNQETKIFFSVGYSLSDTFEKKRRELIKKLDLLNSHKKVSITLKYHEAWGLKNILIDQIHLAKNDYQKTNIQKSINQLDSKK